MAFRTDSTAADANVYDASDIKIWLAIWVDTHPFWSKTVMVPIVE
jgi:ribosomal protein L31